MGDILDEILFWGNERFAAGGLSKAVAFIFDLVVSAS